jgi:integrase/recombinase XerD
MKKTLEQLFQEFLHECEFARRVRPATLRGYKTTYHTFLHFMHATSLENISEQTITEFFKIIQERDRYVGKGIIKTGVKTSTIATYWSKLNIFFQWLFNKGYLKLNPFQKMKYPKPSYENKQFLNKDQIERILTTIHINPSANILLFKRNLVIFYLFLFCGLRKEELLLLQVRDLDFEHKMITIRGETSKSGKTRQIPLHSSLVIHLLDYLKERKNYTTSYLIVSSSRDQQLTENGLKHLVDRIRHISEIPFHLHQLRHTFAVNFLKSTNNIFKLKLLLGHEDIRVTLLYLRCLPADQLKGDIETLRIDSFV